MKATCRRGLKPSTGCLLRCAASAHVCGDGGTRACDVWQPASWVQGLALWFTLANSIWGRGQSQTEHWDGDSTCECVVYTEHINVLTLKCPAGPVQLAIIQLLVLKTGTVAVFSDGGQWRRVTVFCQSSFCNLFWQLFSHCVAWCLWLLVCWCQILVWHLSCPCLLWD